MCVLCASCPYEERKAGVPGECGTREDSHGVSLLGPQPEEAGDRVGTVSGQPSWRKRFPPLWGDSPPWLSSGWKRGVETLSTEGPRVPGRGSLGGLALRPRAPRAPELGPPLGQPVPAGGVWAVGSGASVVSDGRLVGMVFIGSSVARRPQSTSPSWSGGWQRARLSCYKVPVCFRECPRYPAFLHRKQSPPPVLLDLKGN